MATVNRKFTNLSALREVLRTLRHEEDVMSDQQKEKVHGREKKTGKTPSEASHSLRGKETTGRTKDSISTVSYLDEIGHHDEHPRLAVTMENTYQLGPHKRFPVAAATDILKDVLTSYLQQEKYEVEWSQKMTKTLCEVIRACIKDLLIPRYKIVVLVHIGQLSGQSMQVSSRCLWDASSDTSASYVIKNSSLFGLANVYAVYYE